MKIRKILFWVKDIDLIILITLINALLVYGILLIHSYLEIMKLGKALLGL